jgi:hypothetical protein
LILNAVAGWWWADIGAGAILVVYGIREGRAHLGPSAEGRGVDGEQ